MTIKAVDLFCGVGGLTYGLQKAGIPVVAGIDIDDSCEYAYTHNNNCTFIHKSVEDVTGKEIRALLRGADVKILVGCAPCQPFSSHQKDKQNRSKHKDWKLLYQFGRLVEETRPHIVSMENVPELEKEKVFKDFVSTLEGLNYIVNYQVVNVANYGVPQRRKRLILLASRRKEIKLIDATHQKHLTVRDAIGSLPRISAGEANENDRLHISPALSPINLEQIYVIFVTSHNTKSSWGALMEVGAAWITQVEHKIFNIYDFRPEHPLDDEQQWHSSSRDDDGNLYMSKLSVDIFAQKIEYICDKLGYKKRTRQENKDHLSTLVKVTPR